MAQGYVAEGYRVDLLYRQFRASFEGLAGLEELYFTLKRLHRHWQETVNKRFTSLLEAAGGITAIPLSDQTRFWGEAIHDKRRTAVLILDAFRFELGRALEEMIRRWGGPISCEVRPILAPLPSITPLGMARLVAGGAVEAKVENGEWFVWIPGGTSPPFNLAAKNDRRLAIRQRHAKVGMLELQDLRNLPLGKVPKEKLAVVFSAELDVAGHSGVLSLTPVVAEDYVRQVASAIRKLGGAGYEEVHVVTDHGFFLLDEIGDEDVIPCQAEGVRYKSHRVLVAERVETATLIRLPFGREGLALAVPYGVGVLQARGAYEFFHGGASLQELVIPWVIVRFPTKVRPFGLHVEMAPRITTRLFDVTLVAIEPSGQKELLEGQLQARYAELKLFRLKEGRPVGGPLATALGSECFVGAQQREKVVRMRIAEGATFSYGDPVRLIAFDADAPGVELDHQDATIHVEPEA
jgi:hypothetical protein